MAFVGLLTEFPPEGVQHHLGQLTSARVFDNVVGVQSNAFFSFVVFYVLCLFDWVVSHIIGPSRRLLLHFEKRIDVVNKEISALTIEMPYFVYFVNLVPLIEGFVHFGGTPSACEGSLFDAVRALLGSLQQG